MQHSAGVLAIFGNSGIGLPEPRAAINDFSRPASVALPGSRGRSSSAHGLQLVGTLSASPAEAVRGCSPSSSHRTAITIEETIS